MKDEERGEEHRHQGQMKMLPVDCSLYLLLITTAVHMSKPEKLIIKAKQVLGFSKKRFTERRDNSFQTNYKFDPSFSLANVDQPRVIYSRGG